MPSLAVARWHTMFSLSMPWSPNWPARLPDPFPPGPPQAALYKALPGTKPFWTIYRGVTARLR